MIMAGAFWCVVEDDRKGMPKKVMAEVIGEAARLGGPVEAVWLTDKATDEGLKQLAGWGAGKVWLLENAGLAPYRGEVWVPPVAELAAKESPKAILAPVTSRQREFMARLAAKLGVGLSADSVSLAMDGDRLVATRPVSSRGSPLHSASAASAIVSIGSDQSSRTPATVLAFSVATAPSGASVFTAIPSSYSSIAAPVVKRSSIAFVLP